MAREIAAKDFALLDVINIASHDTSAESLDRNVL